MRPARDIIADHLSSVIPPSRAAFNRADNLIRALEGDGYQIVSITKKERRPFVIEDRDGDIDPGMKEAIEKTVTAVRDAFRGSLKD